ncbi:MAG TPA: glycosyltransferase family 39 protein [Candidatus Acidoferrum sp.]|nr:glycosyltransferase family 39 protein [Candidatus Acidoferrum sp.]
MAQAELGNAVEKMQLMKSAWRRAATSLLLIVIVAVGARLAFAWIEAKQIPARVLSIVPFQTETGHIAYSIASGKGFSSPFQRDSGPTAWLAPVYPYILAAIFKLFGIYTFRSFFAAIFLNIVLSAGTCVPIFYAGKRIAGLGVASGAAWLWALFPNAFIIPFEWIWDTSLSALLVAAILWTTVELAESRRLGEWCVYGLLWGFAVLTNPAVAVLFPFLLGWAALRVRGYISATKWLARPALATALAVLCCVPWTVRNYLVFHKFIPLRSNFAFELYIGNNENYDEQHRGRPGVVTQDREILRYLRMGETAFMEEEKRKAAAFIASNPRIELWLISQRFVDFWVGTANPITTFRQADSLWLRFILLCNDAAPFGALLGIIVLLARKNVYAFPVIAFPLVFPLVYYVTHTSLRYRHPLDPVVLLLSAIGLSGLWHWVARNGGKKGPAEKSAASASPA